MENEQLPGDEISSETSQLNQEIGREEGQGSWDELEREEEPDHAEEIESDAERSLEIRLGPGPDEPGELGAPGVDGQEEEEVEQKNTLSDSSPRVLSFKDFFSRD